MRDLPGNDSLIVVAVVFVLLDAEAWVKLIRLRVQQAPFHERREALGMGIAGLAFSLMFVAIIAFGLVAVGPSAFVWPQLRTWLDWLSVLFAVTPLMYLGSRLAGALREAIVAIGVRRRMLA